MINVTLNTVMKKCPCLVRQYKKTNNIMYKKNNFILNIVLQLLV